MSERYEFRDIESKWQRIWEETGTFRARDDADRPRSYVLEMFPYPSGAGLSVGHCKNYAPADAFCRYKSMKGFEVLHPMGWDAFGQPAENEALKRQRHPREMVPEYAASYRRTLQKIGASYDWAREINSSEPEYYKWTQWIFLLLHKRGLAYRASASINWCPSCKTGLANEEVKEGRCWRCDSVVEKRPMQQWYFRITAYADRLLAGLEAIDWPEGIKQQQREWIGRSEGAEVDFPVVGRDERIRIYTTRPDTLWGATFMVLAPEHPLVGVLTAPERREEVDDYVRRAQSQTEIERMSTERTKTGVMIGAHALNPVNGEAIPIYIADYVLMGYGTGAIMAVPAHDQRDFEFARKYGIKVELVYATEGGPVDGTTMSEALPDGGVMRDFTPLEGSLTGKAPFAGMPNDASTVAAVVRWLEEKGVGKGKVQYRLRDWLISRQRYWGAPIPIVHCAACGEVPVPESDLPVLLPQVDQYTPSGTGESPLATIPEFVNVACPRCGGPGWRETDTMGGFACSSWYFLRFADPHNDRVFADRALLDTWLPVDVYMGGAEHAVTHLLYARFWTRVLFDEGLLGFEEPFRLLRNQGSMLAWTPGRRPRAGEVDAEDGEGGGRADVGEGVIDWIVLKPEEREGFPEDQIVWRWARMSKSKGNVVRPDDVVDHHGADSLRLYEMFVAPFEDNVQWSEDGLNGAFRFVTRFWRWAMLVLPDFRPGWRDEIAGASERASEAGNGAVRAIRRKIHQTIRKVDEDIAGFRFNTAVAALMEALNELYAYRPVEGAHAADPVVLSEALESMVLLIAPITPHLADELWERMGRAGSTYRAAWPSFDAAVAAEDEIVVVIQINGKLRDKLTVPVDLPEEDVKARALASAKVLEASAGKTIRNVVYVRGRLVNVVIGQ